MRVANQDLPANGFQCIQCRKWVTTSGDIGTEHRNHCPYCLWSKHVDEDKPGDRKSKCLSPMEPIGLTFKEEGNDKYGKKRQGELMIIHSCTNSDGKININRVAADDDPKEILKVLERSKKLTDTLRENFVQQGIKLLGKEDERQVRTQLFGKS